MCNLFLCVWYVCLWGVAVVQMSGGRPAFWAEGVLHFTLFTGGFCGILLQWRAGGRGWLRCPQRRYLVRPASVKSDSQNLLPFNSLHVLTPGPFTHLLNPPRLPGILLVVGGVVWTHCLSEGVKADLADKAAPVLGLLGALAERALDLVITAWDWVRAKVAGERCWARGRVFVCCEGTVCCFRWAEKRWPGALRVPGQAFRAPVRPRAIRLSPGLRGPASRPKHSAPLPASMADQQARWPFPSIPPPSSTLPLPPTFPPSSPPPPPPAAGLRGGSGSDARAAYFEPLSDRLELDPEDHTSPPLFGNR